jgi:peptidoglycan/LPS O-acetylase OafA/YrhL
VPNPPSPAGQRTTRRISWDIIRVVALLSVMLGHITHQSRIQHPELAGYPFSVDAQYGASILLVVSAYFVCASLRKGKPGRWLWKKVARLLPAYFVAVVLTYVVMRFAAAWFNRQNLPDAPPWYEPSVVDLFANLAMIQSWSTDFQWLDGSYWTLPVQIMAFTAAALLWPRRWRTDFVVVAVIWALIVGPLLIRFVVFQPLDTPDWAVTMIFGLGLHRVHSFAIGIAVWLWAKGRLRHWHLALLLVATVAAQDLNMYPLHYALPVDAARVPSIVGFAVMLLALCAAAKGPDWDLPWLRRLTPVISWLAGISYGVYLVHQELGYILARVLLGAGATGWERLPIVLVAAVLAGWLLTVLVERPVHRRLAGFREVKAPSPALKEQVEAPPAGTSPVSVGGPT